MRARHDAAQPFVRFHAPCNQLQQRRLASAIAPDERQTIAFTDVEVKALEQPAAALNKAKVFIGENRRSEEHTSELQSLMRSSYAVFCLKKKQNYNYSSDMIVQLNTNLHYTTHVDT